jgi:hypothetical protein
VLHCDNARVTALCFVILQVQGFSRSREVNRLDPFWFGCCIAANAYFELTR